MNAWSLVVAIVLAIAAALTGILYLGYDHLTPYFQGIAVESGGVFLEIVLLVAVLGFYEQWRSRRSEIERLRERIDDVKRIDDPHSHGMIASAIRRLAKHKLTNIDLRGIRLTNFSFTEYDISSLEGAIFSDGLHFESQSKNFTKLKGVSFVSMNCEGVKFGTGNLSMATYEDCSFLGTNLRGAKFIGASLSWTKSKVIADENEWDEEIDQEEDGRPIYTRTYYPAFQEANLEGASFSKTRLQYADFRGARNVLNADFTKATGLCTCYFDEGVKEALLLKLRTDKTAQS